MPNPVLYWNVRNVVSKRIHCVTSSSTNHANKRILLFLNEIETSGSILMFIVIEMLPKYLSDVQHYQLINDGFVSGIPFLVTWIIGAIACVVAGKSLKKIQHNITQIQQ